ncbi:MAG TPA: muconolactone Delta-isomerase family protein [Herpetosiphonaceae bacterium]
MTFLVETQFTAPPTPEILALIPQEIAHGKMLDVEGVRLHLFVAADQSRAWQIYRVDSIDDLAAILATFPLHPYLSATITPLAEAL